MALLLGKTTVKIWNAILLNFQTQTLKSLRVTRETNTN